MKKLTPVQERVMKWIDGGWAVCFDGRRIKVNGNKICNLDTVIALENKGLIVRFDRRFWKKAPAKGASNAT